MVTLPQTCDGIAHPRLSIQDRNGDAYCYNCIIESAAAAPEEAVPVAPEDSAQIQSNEASTPEASRTPGVRQYPTPSSPVWWKTLEIVFAILTLAFLGAVFFRWRRNRSQVIG